MKNKTIFGKLKNKYLFLFLISVCLLIPIFNASAETNADSTFEFFYENNSFSITPILIEECNLNQTSVFNIIRTNYYSGCPTAELNYTQQVKLNNETIINKEILKTINSYTKANTGLINFYTNGIYELKFIVNNESFSWIYNINICSEENTSIGDENTTECNCTECEECDECETETEQFYVTSDKSIYSDGEKVEIIFKNVEVDDFNLTYWIEDLSGKIIKNKLTTKNTLPKSYTINVDDNEEKIYLIKAVLQINNLELESEKLIVGVGNQNENSTFESTSNKLNVEEATFDYELNTLIFKALIEKNIGTKRIVTISATNEENKRICENAKVDVLKNSKVYLYSNLICDKLLVEKSSQIELHMEGLDSESDFEINLDSQKFLENVNEINSLKLINGTTKKIYLDDSMSWQVKFNGTGKGIVVLSATNNEIKFKEINISSKKTIDFELNMGANMNITTYLVTEYNIQNITQELKFLTKEEYEKNLTSKTVNEKLNSLSDDLNALNTIGITDLNNLISANVIKEDEEINIASSTKLKNILVWCGITCLLVICATIFMWNKKTMNNFFDRFIKK